jgi:hypothetical protein
MLFLEVQGTDKCGLFRLTGFFYFKTPLDLLSVCSSECFPYELLTLLLMIESVWGIVQCNGMLKMLEVLPSLR